LVALNAKIKREEPQNNDSEIAGQKKTLQHEGINIIELSQLH
jgi:hypothetical protein